MGRIPCPSSGVAATVLTARGRLIVRLDGEAIADHRFPIDEKLVSTYHPTARRGLYDHITA